MIQDVSIHFEKQADGAKKKVGDKSKGLVYLQRMCFNKMEEIKW